MKKTNAVRILEQQKVDFELLEYGSDEENLSIGKIAKENGLDVKQIFKTLVAKGDKNGVVVAVISGSNTLDMKALAKFSQNKKIALVPVKNLLQLTGYIRGGCSPIGMKKSYPVYLDASAEHLEEIYVNAGMKGLLVKLKVERLIEVTNGMLVEIGIKVDD